MESVRGLSPEFTA